MIETVLKYYSNGMTVSFVYIIVLCILYIVLNIEKLQTLTKTNIK